VVDRVSETYAVCVLEEVVLCVEVGEDRADPDISGLAVPVFELFMVADRVPVPLAVFVPRTLTVAEAEPVEVLLDETLPVLVTVPLTVGLIGGDREALGLAEGVREPRMEADRVALPVELLDCAILRVGVALPLEDLETLVDDVPVFVVVMLALGILLPVPVRVDACDADSAELELEVLESVLLRVVV